jgi:Cof subfamily protein (haloacid dehalogenase superfamily)
VTGPVRLVATDLDGTLFAPGYVVTARTRAAISATVASGIPVVVATGRSQWTAEPLLLGVAGLDLVVCSNGASRYSLLDRRSLLDHPIAPRVVDDILRTLAEVLPGCVFGWETAAGLEHEAGFHDPPHLDPRPTSPPLHQRGRGAAIRKLLVAHPELTAHALLEEVRPRLPGGCVAACSGAPFVEVTGEGVDKAFGIRAVCADLGVDAASVLAFGDNDNDIALLRWAGRSVAMGNARPEVKAVAGEVTTACDADGVAAVLETLG